MAFLHTNIIETEKIKTKDPICVLGLPGIGNVGRVAAKYMVEKLGAKKFAKLYSSHFLPFVVIHDDNRVHVLKNEFYFWKAKKKGQRDLIIITGDSQSITPEGHYHVVEAMLEFLAKFGVKFIVTMGGLQTGEMSEKPKVIGAVTNTALIKKYAKAGVEFNAAERVGTIVGASGLLIGMGHMKGMDGICLLGETAGMPIVTDPKSAEAVLNSLTKIIGVDIDMKDLDKKVKEMEAFIGKIEGLQKKAMQHMDKPPTDDTKYIG